MAERVAMRLVVRGRVQGVGFRDAMGTAAAAHGIAGWVRNRADGSVEAVVCGPVAAVEAMLAWTRQGPRGAHVLVVETEDCDGDFDRFERRPTS